MKDGYRSENLESQTFPDASFDLVITQDVFEHVLDPAQAFAEIARTLKPGGAHVFTIPWYYWKPTRVRAERDLDGSIRHLVEPDYHGSPIDPNGSLVVTEWGSDFCDFVYQCSGLTTTAIRIHDWRRGIEAKFIEVFISRKADAHRSGAED
jgi:SAM-dependent methyltransferase